MAASDLKKKLRAEIKEWFKSHINEDFSINSGKTVLSRLTEMLPSSADSAAPLKISIFISKFPEISTIPMIRYFFERGHQIFIPAWHQKEMWMCRVDTVDSFNTLIQSAPQKSIPMPSSNRVSIKEVIYDFIIMPGLLFDKNCHRLGYGYGHYDSFLSLYYASNNTKDLRTRLVGVGYDEQIHEEYLPFEEHDIQLHSVITPSFTINNNAYYKN